MLRITKKQMREMFSLSNGLSLLRAPLALLFLSQGMILRLAAIVLAMVTDTLDGFLARRRRSTTQFGAVLDPAMDKLFVFFVLAILFFEHQFALWQVLAMISRDFFLCIFAFYLKISKKWQAYQFRSIRWGKATTALQFAVLICVTLHVNVPAAVFAIFILFGMLAFFELYQLVKKQPTNHLSKKNEIN